MIMITDTTLSENASTVNYEQLNAKLSKISIKVQNKLRNLKYILNQLLPLFCVDCGLWYRVYNRPYSYEKITAKILSEYYCKTIVTNYENLNRRIDIH